MRQLIALALASVLILAVVVPPAHAGGAGTDVALGLASFAVFNQLFGPAFYPRPVYAVPVVTAPPVVYAPYPTVYTLPAPVVATAPPPAPMPTVVQYPHGRYELRGDGLTVPYQWVWIPNPPPPPPPPAPQP